MDAGRIHRAADRFRRETRSTFSCIDDTRFLNHTIRALWTFDDRGDEEVLVSSRPTRDSRYGRREHSEAWSTA